MNYEFMNKITIFTLLSVLGLSFASCDDEFDINKLYEDPQLLVYCFPTEGDSTVVAVYRTLPVNADNINELAGKPLEAQVVYKVNGQEMPVRRITEDDAARLSIDAYFPINGLIGQYYAIGSQKTGDRIDVEVSAEGLPTASASTYIPEKVEVGIDTVVRDVYIKNDGYYSTFNSMTATFSDNGTTADYYMVRMNESRMAGRAVGSYVNIDNEERWVSADDYSEYKMYNRTYPSCTWDLSQLQWHRRYVYVSTVNEPVLQQSSPIDEEFGFDEYYNSDMAYFFNDQLFNGRSYKLRLDITTNMYSNNVGSFTFGDWDEFAGGYLYALQFYKLTKEYYRFIKNKNDRENNSWADNGFMAVTPNYTNVHGGLGIVAGYAVSAPTYWMEVKENDNIYTDDNK